jgi:hypothetical protein
MRISTNKILITLTCFCFLITTPAEAQETVTGIKAGYNSSRFVGSAIPDADHLRMPGINFGGIVNKHSQYFDLQFELIISSKGYQVKSIGDTHISNLLVYIDLPIIVKKDLFTGTKFGFYLTGGISIMFNVLSINLVSELEGVRKFDSGILFGLGTQFRRLSFELRITQSIINFDRIEPIKYNQVISAGLTFYFKEPKG